MSERGHFIAFEGGEGSGKSTQAALLAAELDALLTVEPGGTVLGARIRSLVLDPGVGPLAERAEALLMAADRAQHVAEVVEPALAAGRHVVTDRYEGSSLAYQGYGRGLNLDELRWLSRWASSGLVPDLVILLDVPAEVAAVRLAARPGETDRFEGESRAFHERVLAGFRAIAAADPDRWAIVDGTGSVAEVAQRVRAVCRARLGLR